MTELTEQQTRALLRAADEAEIRNMVAKIAHYSDYSELEKFAALFTEDCVFEILTPSFEYEARGREALLRGALKGNELGRQGLKANTRHLVTTHWIEIDGDTATGGAYAFIFENIHIAPKPPQIMTAMVYEDRYTRTPDGWKVALRRIKPR